MRWPTPASSRTLAVPCCVPRRLFPQRTGWRIQETDPQYGPEAALSAFNAQFSTSLFFQKTLQEYNNQLNGVNGFFEQQFDNFNAQISKRTVTGDQFTFRHSADYNDDNNLGNQIPGGVYDVLLEGEVRHPFLQGSGVDFNRIAGPGTAPACTTAYSWRV